MEKEGTQAAERRIRKPHTQGVERTVRSTVAHQSRLGNPQADQHGEEQTNKKEHPVEPRNRRHQQQQEQGKGGAKRNR